MLVKLYDTMHTGCLLIDETRKLNCRQNDDICQIFVLTAFLLHYFFLIFNSVVNEFENIILYPKLSVLKL